MHNPAGTCTNYLPFPCCRVLKLTLRARTFLIPALLVTPGIARAQAVHFAGVESVVASTNLSNPVQVAVDTAGNVFVLDAGSSRVLKEVPSAGGYQESVVTATTMNSPTGLALDPSGHVFVVDSGNNRILEESPSGSSPRRIF